MLTKIDAAAMDAETVQMLSMIDEEKDANVIITAEGVIQFANKGVQNVCFQGPRQLLLVFCSATMKSPKATLHAPCSPLRICQQILVARTETFCI